MSEAAPPPPSLLQRLDYWALRQPNKTLFSYLGEDGKVTESYTYGELSVLARGLGSRIILAAATAGTTAAASAPLVAGDRVLLVYMPSLDFVVAFLACLSAGLVPVPVYPPDPRRSKAYVAAFAQIAADCGAKAALSHAEYRRAVSLAALADGARRLFSFGFSKGGAKGPEWPDLRWIYTTDLVTGTTAAAVGMPPAAVPVATSPAFLQYTSGSTAEPKGVIITHACMQHNLASIVTALAAIDDTVVVSWLPQYHDMGLIGECLTGAHK